MAAPKGQKVYGNAAATVTRDGDGNYVVTTSKGLVVDTIDPSEVGDEFARARATDLADLLCSGPVTPDQVAMTEPPNAVVDEDAT
jgi:hypothetical protein